MSRLKLCLWCGLYKELVCHVVVLLVVIGITHDVNCTTVIDDYLTPYDMQHGSSRSLREIASCQHTMWENRTIERQSQHDTGYYRDVDLYSFVQVTTTRKQPIIGRIAFVDKPLHTVSVLEPQKVGGCEPSYFGGATVSVVSDTVKQRNSKCKVAINAGFFNPYNGKCLGNIISSLRLVQTQDIQLANFGIRQDGTIVIGYISKEDIYNATVPFKQLISGVVWLVRNGSNFVNQSSLLECDENQKTGKMQTFIDVVSARTAIGHTKDGKLVVAQVEGQTHVYGANLYEFADILISKGVVNAINLDGGGSATFLVDGVLTNHPSDDCKYDKGYRCPRQVSTVICIHDPECTIPDCSRHGICNDKYDCVCRDPWFGYGCHLLNCTQTNCSGHGTCKQDGCACDNDWTGDLCDQRCDPGYYGPRCAWHCTCSPTGRGRCTTGSYGCTCDPGWKGISCNEKCPPGLYGHNCAEQCPFPECSGHGYCSNVDGLCTCDKDWAGVACNVSLYQRFPDTFCSWHISNKDNATLLCNVNFGQVINILSYNLTNNLLLKEPRNLTRQENFTTECTARSDKSSSAPFTVAMVIVIFCLLTTIINIIVCIAPGLYAQRIRNNSYKDICYEQLKSQNQH